MGTPSIAVPTIVSQRTAYVPQQPIVPQVFVQTGQPVIRTIPSQIIVSSILPDTSGDDSVKRIVCKKNFC
jgi:hypothetical protein